VGRAVKATALKAVAAPRLRAFVGLRAAPVAQRAARRGIAAMLAPRACVV
jgi:hypothetical protein